MSLQTICENIALDLGISDIGAPYFQSKVSQNRRLVAQVRKAANSLYRRANWAQLTVEYNFTSTGDADFPLPSDLGWIVNNTAWEATRYWKMSGSLSPQEWRKYKNSVYGRSTIWRRWRVRLPSGAGAGEVTVFSVDPPVPSSDHTSKFVYEYVSTNWCLKQDGTTAPDWTADTDVSLLDEYVIELGGRWRTLRRLGLAYDEDKDEYEREVDKLIARNGGPPGDLQLVPHQRTDFIGQYTLGAFPPVPPQPAPAATIAAAAERPLLGQPQPPPGPLSPGRPRRVIPSIVRVDD